MKISAGVIPYKVKDNELYFFVGHPGGKFWEHKNYWALLKGEQKENEDIKDTAIREFYEESGIKIEDRDTLYDLGVVNQNKNKNVQAFAWKCDIDFDINKCHSNMADNGLNNEIDKYRWMKLDEVKKVTHKKHKIFYDTINDLVKENKLK